MLLSIIVAIFTYPIQSIYITLSISTTHYNIYLQGCNFHMPSNRRKESWRENVDKIAQTIHSMGGDKTNELHNGEVQETNQ